MILAHRVGDWNGNSGATGGLRCLYFALPPALSSDGWLLGGTYEMQGRDHHSLCGYRARRARQERAPLDIPILQPFRAVSGGFTTTRVRGLRSSLPAHAARRTSRANHPPMPWCFLTAQASPRGRRTKASRQSGRSRTVIWKWSAAAAASVPKTTSVTANCTSSSARLRRPRATASRGATAASFSTGFTRCRCSTATTTLLMPMGRRRLSMGSRRRW